NCVTIFEPGFIPAACWQHLVNGQRTNRPCICLNRTKSCIQVENTATMPLIRKDTIVCPHVKSNLQSGRFGRGFCLPYTIKRPTHPRQSIHRSCIYGPVKERPLIQLPALPIVCTRSIWIRNSIVARRIVNAHTYFPVLLLEMMPMTPKPQGPVKRPTGTPIQPHVFASGLLGAIALPA